MEQLDVNRVYLVYVGRREGCRCGCLGKYKIASAWRDYADRDRGYIYDDEEVSDRQVRKVTTLLNARIVEGVSLVEVGGNYVDWADPDTGRVYTAYLVQ